MATINSRDDKANGLTSALRRRAPGGAYWRYAAYVSAIVALAALGGYASALALAGSPAGKFGAIYTGILTCLSMLFLKPTAACRPYREIAAACVAILIGAGIGGAVGHHPGIAQPVTVVIAFAGFYVRRWPEPLPMAGLVVVMSFIISQILAPFTPAGVIHASILPLIVFVSIGFWFLPRRVFTRAFLMSVLRMRSALPAELTVRPDDKEAVAASVRRIDALLRQVNDARVQADQYDPANAAGHLALVHWSATVARVWENAADGLYRVTSEDFKDQPDAASACRAAEAAVAEAIARPSKASRGAAEIALARIEKVVATLAGHGGETGGGTGDGGDQLSQETGTALIHLINSQLTLTHLLDAVAKLDAELARQSEASR